MKKLLDWYKNLPPEFKMLIALAGLGTPSGLIYLLVSKFHLSYMQVIIGMMVVVVVVSFAGLIISRLFSVAGRRRTRRLEDDLTRGADASPVSMDLRGAIKSNNEKFFNAIREMRRNLRISVYDLPWYVVIGDSGCGKTRLINEGGLTFSTGKPEGYQLGTLNYNWWFTEDAVFVDMAGRLCNPQDDADRREWLAFLDTIAKGRRGFPVNGVIVCVSAEHLLQDPPEKHEADANTALERLRDLQTKLGVTFATYLVVTKCDKILGFMQFFDRAERDVSMKNQIFGWSRAGNFNELYDPERFSREFDEVYGRLGELRLRRLNDDVGEIELGLAYSFPEEFRQLREPLQTYVRTLFPMIKNPRAVKNLIFRGAYFTSATQQGAVILKHLVARMGEDAAGQFAPLESLYPQPRPHFVKDLLFRKVFPEQGLVFRNENQVIRNRKLSKLLRFGSVGLAACLFGALIWSAVTFSHLLGGPRERARSAPAKVTAPSEALAGARALDADVSRLVERPWPARILSLGVGADRPSIDLATIEVRLFEDGVLRRVFASVGEALRDTKLAPAAAGGDLGPARKYLDALEQYVLWFALHGQESMPDELSFESFQKLCAVVSDPQSPVNLKGFTDQAGSYFSRIRDKRGLWKRNPAKLLGEPGLKAAEIIQAAVINAHNHLAGYASLSPNHPDLTIREWTRIHKASGDATAAYGEVLKAADAPVATQKDLVVFRQTFLDNFTKFEKALGECEWRGGGDVVRIGALKDAILKQRQTQWLDFQDRLKKAMGSGGGADSTILRSIGWLVVGDDSSPIQGLDVLLAGELKNRGLTTRAYSPAFFADVFPGTSVLEVLDADKHLIQVQRATDRAVSDKLMLTGDAERVRAILSDINTRLAKADFTPPAQNTDAPSAWVGQLDAVFAAGQGDASPASKPGSEAADSPWQPARRDALVALCNSVIGRGSVTRLLLTIAARLEQAQSLKWGLAELYPDWNEKCKSAFQIEVPSSTEQRPSPTKAETAAEPARARPVTGSRIRRPGEAPNQPVQQTGPQPIGLTLEGYIPKCATQEYLNERAWDCVQLLVYLEQITPKDYLPPGGGEEELNAVCLKRLKLAGQAYTSAYVAEWSGAYKRKQLPELDALMTKESWGSMADTLKLAGSKVGDQVQGALQELLQVLPWADLHPKWGRWNDEGIQNKDTRQWGEPVVWVGTAFRDKWPQDGGAFVRRAQLPDKQMPNVQPWVQLASEFGTAWQETSREIIANASLPRPPFDSTTAARPRVQWARINQLREKARLDDDAKLTGQVAAFVKRSQELESADLTRILLEVQEKHLQKLAYYDGWPYLNHDATGISATDTVKYADFREFLKEISEAGRVLEPLEKDLPEDTPYKKQRQEFLAQCAEWVKFLAADARGAPTALPVEIWYYDPLSPDAPGGRVPGIQDTAGRFYTAVELSLGLAIKEASSTAGPAAEAPLRILTVPRGPAAMQAEWRWVGSGNELRMQLVEGVLGATNTKPYPQIPAMTLGKSSPLAFCAYLHRYGQYVERDNVWVSAHDIDLKEAFEKVGQADLVPKTGRTRMGAKFGFRLGRDLPRPIVPLTGPAAEAK